MCIRDSYRPEYHRRSEEIGLNSGNRQWRCAFAGRRLPDDGCLLYTSDAADERSSVDLGGRRIIKKKKKTERGDSGVIKKTQQKQIATY